MEQIYVYGTQNKLGTKNYNCSIVKGMVEIYEFEPGNQPHGYTVSCGSSVCSAFVSVQILQHVYGTGRKRTS